LVAGKARDYKSGVDLAIDAIRSGAANKTLVKLVEVSNS